MFSITQCVTLNIDVPILKTHNPVNEISIEISKANFEG